MASTSTKFASNFYLRAIDSIKNKEQKLKEESERKKQIDGRPYDSCRAFLTPNAQRNVYKTSNCTYTYTSSARQPVNKRVYLTDQ